MEWIDRNSILVVGIIDRINPGSWNDWDKKDEMKGKTELVKIYSFNFNEPRILYKGGVSIEIKEKIEIHYNIQNFPKQVIRSVDEKNPHFKESYFSKYVVDATLEDAKELALDTIRNYIKELNNRI